MTKNFLFAGVILASVGVAPAARAFCRTTTCDQGNKDDHCVSEGGCVVTGLPLMWAGRCISFGVDHDGSVKRGISYDTALSIIAEAYRTWQNADCGGGETPSLSVRGTRGEDEKPEPIFCDRQEYNKIDGNANAWLFQDDDWPYARVANHLALTTLTFNPESGEIYDVDVEVNTADNAISTGDSNVTNDLASIVTHEAGHFFGLSHSTVPGATMLADYKAGSTDMRSLAPDDIQGICSIYPPGRQAPPCATTEIPRHGFSAVCGVNQEEDSGCCTTAPGSRVSSGLQAIFAVGFGAMTLGLRRRKKRLAALR